MTSSTQSGQKPKRGDYCAQHQGQQGYFEPARGLPFLLKHGRHCITLLLALLFPVAAYAGGYCEPLTISHVKVPNTDQSNYNLLIHGTYWWMADFSHSGLAITGNNGYDIRFYSDSGCSTTALNFWRGYWSNTGGAVTFRVRVPTASHTSDTTIYVKIGDPADTSDLSTTWFQSYGVVGLYAAPDPSTVSLTDYGSANFTLQCDTPGVTSATSPVGGGWYIPDTTHLCGAGPNTVGDSLSAHGYPVGSQAGHIRYWFKNTSATSSGGTFNDVTPAAYGKANSTGQRGLETEYRTCQISGLGEQQFGTPGPGIVATSPTGCSSTSTPTYTMDVGVWHVWEFDQPTNGATYSQAAVYFDGVKVASPIYWGGSTGATVVNTADAPYSCPTCGQSEIRFGRMAAHGAAYFTGYIAEFEVTNTSWSADLVTTRYNNESSPDTFYSFALNLPARYQGVTLKGVTAK